jgi:type IV secretory pathway TraG/TraD family ATPase VirD4
MAFLRILRRAFGAGGPAALRHTGYIARANYVVGGWLAFIWIFMAYFVAIEDHAQAVYSIFDSEYTIPAVQETLDRNAANPAVAAALKKKESADLDRRGREIFNEISGTTSPPGLEDKKYRDAVRELARVGYKSSDQLMGEYRKQGLLFFAFGALIALGFWVVIFIPRYGLFGKLSRVPASGSVGVGRIVGPVLAITSVSLSLLAVFRFSSYDVSVLGTAVSAFLVFGVPLLLLVGPTASMTVREYIKEWDWYREAFIQHKPAARWGGIRSFIKYDIGDFFPANASSIAHQATSTIYLGKTLAAQDPRVGGRHIGLCTETHMMTVALTGAGKSRDAIWNTLLSWPGGAFVFDPKGEHTQLTFERRSRHKPAFVLDPYRMAPHIAETAHYNPLDEIDPDSPTAGADIMTVAQSSLYIEKAEGSNAAHFRENAQTILKGFVAHVMTRYPAHKRNLPGVFDLLATGSIDGEQYDVKAMAGLLTTMRSNAACGKAPMFAVKILDDVSAKEAGSYLSTIYRGISWVNDPPVRRTLLYSDFRMGDLKSREISVYVVLPRRRIAQQSRWVRTLADFALYECEETKQPEGSQRKVLLLLDEFAQLGPFRPIKDGLVTVRSANIKLWVLFQNIGQIHELYENAHDFFSSCDQQYFGVHPTDNATKEHISTALGNYLHQHKEGREGQTHHEERERALMTPQAVAEFLKAAGHNQIVFVSDSGTPLKLRRVPFYENCTPDSYGTVQDLEPTITSEQIAEELAAYDRPFKEENERLRREAEEAQRAAEQQRAEEKAEWRAKEDAKADSGSYTPDQDVAKDRFYLPDGFTCDQLNERYRELIERASTKQLDQVHADYETLLSCCA